VWKPRQAPASKFRKGKETKKWYPVETEYHFIFMKTSDYTVDNWELILVKTLPMIGPRINKTAITTTATKTRINAYSTRPWPFSFGANNMGIHLLPLVDFPESHFRDAVIIYLFVIEMRYIFITETLQ
jgi:hypothetical protein